MANLDFTYFLSFKFIHIIPLFNRIATAGIGSIWFIGSTFYPVSVSKYCGNDKSNVRIARNSFNQIFNAY